MKVLQVTHYMPPHPGGIEQVGQALAEGLVEKGFDVRWVASATPEPPGITDRIFRVPTFNELERRKGMPFPLWSPWALPTLAQWVRWADVLLVHDCLYLGNVAACALAARVGVPWVLTQHVGYVPFGPWVDGAQRLAYRTVGATLLRGARRRIACTPHVPEFFASLGMTLPFEQVPNGIDERRFFPRGPEERKKAREAFGLPEEAPIALFAGRLVAKKGLSTLVEGAPRLAQNGVTVVVAGDGPDRPLVENCPGLRALGLVPKASMPDLVAAADILVLPSHGEGLPLVAQEGLLSGVGLVASTDEAFRANLNGAPGVSFSEGGPAWADAVLHALAHRPEPSTIASWARSRWGREPFLAAYARILREAASTG